MITSYGRYLERLMKYVDWVYTSMKIIPGKEKAGQPQIIFDRVKAYAREINPKEDLTILRADVGQAIHDFLTYKRINRKTQYLPGEKNRGIQLDN